MFSPSPRITLLAVLVTSGAVLSGQGPNFSNRWEGLATQHNVGQNAELRSFVGLVEPYPATQPVNLTVTYYVPDSSKAFIEGHEITPVRNYLMRPNAETSPAAGWRSFTGWPTGDVLVPNGITSDKLGMVISLGASGPGVTRYAPAIIFHTTPPAPISTYTLAFSTVDALNPFSLVVGGQGYQRRYPHSEVADNSTVIMTFDALSIPEGKATLLVSAGYQDLAITDRLTLAMEFFHKPLR